MAAGTLVSRLTGFVRAFLLAAALGNLLRGDLFAIAITIPNMLYILLAGGIFNAVLVPQLVRATSMDPDGGEAYRDRVVTIAALFLGTVTVLLVLAAPWVMDLFLDPSYREPDLAAQRASIVNLARYCLPQVFFYGMFVLVGQILNARGRFGPMMWAPIANNVISILVLTAYLVLYGPAAGSERCAAFKPEQELLLGVGSTLGIVVQFLILLPYLRAAGIIRFRPRFDFRDSAIGRTLRLGIWTVLVVAVNQVAYTIVVRLASGGTAQQVSRSCDVGSAAEGTGYLVYSTAFLIVMVPHSIVTVSLATAVLPRMSMRAAHGDFTGLASSLASTLRMALLVILPFALIIPIIADDVANAISFGAARATYQNYELTLALFGPGLLFFTIHYLMLRGFFALERTRTVLWVQCVIAAINIAVAVSLVEATDDRYTAPSLAVAYGSSFAAGSILSYLLLRRALGGLETAKLAGFLSRMIVAAGASTGIAYILSTRILATIDEPSQIVAALRVLAVTVAAGLVFVGLARLLRIPEVTQVMGVMARHTRRQRC